MPEKFGRYEVRGLVGEGSMGRVYRAFDPLAKRVVAVKTLKWEYLARAKPEDNLRRFLRESHAAASLAHPNVITLFDVGEDYFVMELLEGQTLERMLRSGGRLDPAQALGILGPVADGIDYAHSKGIIHRDIKPSNIMILPDGRPKITDFGVAYLGSTNMTADGEFVGSPSYMAPEQITSSTASSRTDLFSLAVLAYEMLTGCKPFEGSTISQIIYHVVNTDPPPPSSVNPALPARYDDLFRRALGKDPAVRFPSATAFVAALGRRSADGAVPGGPALAGAAPATALSFAEVETEDLRRAPTPEGASVHPPATPGGAGGLARPFANRRWLAIVAVLLGAVSVFGLVRFRQLSPSPVSPALGGIEVATDPAGADVRIDGAMIARAPTSLSGLSPGPHTVVVSLQGFSSAELRLVLSPGPIPVPLRFTLLPMETSLQVASEPSGARVSVDGKVVGTTPLETLAVSPGFRRVEIKYKGFQPWTQTVEARAGDKIPLLARLEPESAPGTLRAALRLGGWVQKGDLVQSGPGVTAPRRISGEAAPYPEAAKRLRLEGSVTVEMIVTERGEPVNLRVVESAGEIFDTAVLAAVRTWRYAPAEKDGVEVRVRIRARQLFTFTG
jgi:eukaryotic-like serine/threonine-protein kinase